jgi:type II restriction/modification system DNA methylase subunit YeeA
MNTPGITPGGRFQGTPYFNGGLFAEIPRIELAPSQLDLLVESAREDWKSVRPSIFGNIFEASSNQARRHSLGQHFTSEPDILKVVRPTIIEPWEERIDEAKTIDELETLLFDLQQFRVLDPACGSGNFLYMAYNALKDLEAAAMKKLRNRRTAKETKLQPSLAFVNTNQFYGLDTDAFAVELARVTLMIARKVAHDRLGLTEQELPLDNLDKNIVKADALFEEWPEANAIIGNPPFLGGKHMRLNLSDEYVDRVFGRYPDVKDSVDFCTYWFRLANQRMGKDGRAGLVATNSIRHGKSRRASLDYVRDNGGHIHSAVSTQPWSGEANVHVSIVNWSRQKPTSYRLDDAEVDNINTSLRSTTDVSEAVQLKANKGFCFQGVIPVGKGFNVEPATAEEWLAKDPKYAEVVKPFSMGTNLAKRELGKPDRWIIDFADRCLEEIEDYPLPYKQVVELVKPERLINRDKGARLYWWRFLRPRPEMRQAIEGLPYYFAVPRVSKWAVFIRFEKKWLPGEKNVVLATDDFYVLGLLTSSTHRKWMHSQKGTLKGDIAYTHDTCFETFPFPQLVTAQQADAIRHTMAELNEYRNTWMTEKQSGITDLYNRYYEEPASKLSQLHRALDAQVLKAYGWSAGEDLLSNLLDLNMELEEREKEGLQVVGPWDPNKAPR